MAVLLKGSTVSVDSSLQTALSLDAPGRAAGNARLSADDVTIGYDKSVISEHLSVQIPDGSFTVIVGPNACGKSTLLRSLSRLIRPTEGQIVLDGQAITSYRAKELARQLGLLPQTSLAPDGITVADLVSRGRYPHQGLIKQWSAGDEQAVSAALAATNTSSLSTRLVDELSGGQRQRVWVAMVLAQQTDILLLDEPTTFLDIAHQIELLELFERLNREGRTMVAVLHDLNHAARFATHIIAMRDGQIVAQGDPREIITAELVEDVFGLPCVIISDPISGTPLVVPRGSHHSQALAIGATT
jgi:ABC-type cobalamin/Fe3+-siderophores transport system ATPase subunit